MKNNLSSCDQEDCGFRGAPAQAAHDCSGHAVSGMRSCTGGMRVCSVCHTRTIHWTWRQAAQAPRMQLSHFHAHICTAAMQGARLAVKLNIRLGRCQSWTNTADLQHFPEGTYRKPEFPQVGAICVVEMASQLLFLSILRAGGACPRVWFTGISKHPVTCA